MGDRDANRAEYVSAEDVRLMIMGKSDFEPCGMDAFCVLPAGHAGQHTATRPPGEPENELRAWERYHARWFAPTPGQLVYERWCASRQTDRARYYARMNPAEREAWENMAAELRERLGPEEWDAFIHFEGRHNVGA